MITIGIDASTTCTGVAIVDPSTGLAWAKAIKAKAKGANWIGRSLSIADAVRDAVGWMLVARHGSPITIAIESPFAGRDHSVSAKLGFVRGAVISSLHQLPAMAYLSRIVDVSPTAVKLAAAGNGRSSKEHVAKCLRLAVRNMSVIEVDWESDDATDALAVAMAVNQEKTGAK